MRGMRAQRRLGLVAAGLVLVGGATAAAQPMRLEDALRATLSGSVAVQREDERVNRAAGRLRQAQSVFDWQALADTGWERLYVPRVRNGFLTDETDQVDAWRTTVGIGRKFRNGIEIRPGVTFYADTGGTTSGQTLGQTRTRPNLGLTVPILKGLGESNSAVDERAAEQSLAGAQFNRSFAAQRAVHDTVQTFWRCLGATKQLEIILTLDRDSRENVEALRRLADRGQLERTQAQRAEAAHVLRHVETGRAGEVLATCQRDLAQLAGGRPAPVGEFPAIANLEPAIDAIDPTRMVELALTRREDLRASERLLTAESTRLKGAQDSTLPKLDVYADPQRAGLRYTQTLHGDLEKGQVTEFSAAESEARLNRQQLESQVRAEVEDAIRQLRLARGEWLALTRSATLMETVVADTRRRAAAGLIDRKELRDTQDQLAQAKRQIVQASQQAAASLAALRLATGTIEIGESPLADTLAAAFLTPPVP
jgi:outer membrane protein TolC